MKINAHTTEGLFEVDADVFGAFAVHPSIVRGKDRNLALSETHWSITHIQTGYASSRQHSTKWRAAAMACLMNDALRGVDFDTVDSPEFRAFRERARRIYREIEGAF